MVILLTVPIGASFYLTPLMEIRTDNKYSRAVNIQVCGANLKIFQYMGILLPERPITHSDSI